MTLLIFHDALQGTRTEHKIRWDHLKQCKESMKTWIGYKRRWVLESVLLQPSPMNCEALTAIVCAQFYNKRQLSYYNFTFTKRDSHFAMCINFDRPSYANEENEIL